MRLERYLGFVLLLLFLSFFTFVSPVQAVPAAPGEIVLTQPDGSQFVATIWGDEHQNGFQTQEGYTILKNTSEWWVYAQQASSNSQLSPLAGLSGQELIVGQASTTGLVKGIRPAPADSKAFEPPATRKVANFGSQPLVVLLVSFSDRGFTYPVSTFADTVFLGTNTVSDFYLQASYNQLDLVPATEWQGDNDGIIAGINLGYPHPDTAGDTRDSMNRQIVRDALIKADANIDYLSYDLNYDGMLTPDELHIMLIVAGYEAATSGQSPAIWAHWSALGWDVDAPILDEVAVGLGGYTMVGEIFDDHPATLGTLVHELGHDLGWPDLYDYSGQSYGVGTWCLMGHGSWNALPGQEQGASPALPSAFLKANQQWLYPQVFERKSDGYELLWDAALYDSALIYPFNPGKYDAGWGYGEYFLLEYRSLTGYDAALPGEGVLIWHIDETVRNGNINRDHPLAKLMQADGLDELYSTVTGNTGDAGDPFAGVSNKTFFDDTSNPSSRYYGNKKSEMGVYFITTTGPVVVRLFYWGSEMQASLPIIRNGNPIIRNGDFEQIRRGEWVQYSEKWGNKVIWQDGSGNNWVADFGLANNELAKLSQTNIPRKNGQWLHMRMYIESEEPACGNNWDTFRIMINGKLVEHFDLCRDSLRWFTRSYYLEDYTTSPTYTLQFVYSSDGSNHSRVMVDDIHVSKSGWYELAPTMPAPGGLVSGWAPESKWLDPAMREAPVLNK